MMQTDKFNLEFYSYDLPEKLIAHFPLPCRSDSRMIIISRETGVIDHRTFNELPDLIPADTLMVLNNTRVIPARLRVKRKSGGKGEIFLLKKTDADTWRALARPARKMRAGDRFACSDILEAEIIEDLDQGEKIVKLETPLASIEQALEQAGEVPLPPYIQREHSLAQDRERYQTVYASRQGSSAAPTAGLHFTEEILARIRERGIETQEVTLHVGGATFLPVRSPDIREHRMHSEEYSIGTGLIRKVKSRDKPVLAVGTTSMRTLETAVRIDPVPDNNTASGETDLFIYPGFEFKAVDMLLTNFHLPGSTLLMLVCGFAGRDLTITAYEEAIKQQYRFYSYGDCMLIM
jgi:S-adenosylmethionine:tRNA ribosyltransferase-isomerase